MKTLTIPVSEEILFVLKRDIINLQEEVQRIIAIDFFKNKKLSLGKAAEFAGISKDDFVILLGEHKIDIYRYGVGEFEDELDIVNAYGSVR